jgi:hypothetical protein
LQFLEEPAIRAAGMKSKIHWYPLTTSSFFDRTADNSTTFHWISQAEAVNVLCDDRKGVSKLQYRHGSSLPLELLEGADVF